ncbi:DUF3160 domain-containing protein [Bacteroidota bacterium]
MKRATIRYFWAAAFVLVAATAPAGAQVAPPWDLTVYRDYFEKNTDMTAADLLSEYSAGTFAETAPTDFAGSAFATDIQTIFELTPDEIVLIQRHGFVVSERMSYESFGHALYDVFVNDMPVYVSSDAILQALHKSYDDILIDIERTVLIPDVRSLISGLHSRLPALADSYGNAPEMQQMFKDVDLYLTIPRRLLGENAQLLYPDNESQMSTLLDGIFDARPIDLALFADVTRTLDLSQFQPRGHYAGEADLEAYFRAMMWLGRTELYLIGPKGTVNPPSKADVQRQVIMTTLLSELLEDGSAELSLERIDLILRTMVGESDNVTLSNVRSVLDEAGIQNAAELLDSTRVEVFQELLAEKPLAFQRILSQILISGGEADSIEPAAAFLLLGQRFIIDSYVTASVVYDKIEYQGHKVRRMMPSTLDILFALGNDAAAQFLEEELEHYKYAPYLASLRHLIDSYDEKFWASSMYNGWLNAIRQLSPPFDRASLPDFMQTAGWWQKEMNTQLASWAQLRHDNLLYAKQSYTGGVVCVFPESYVEPIPAFFLAVGAFGRQASTQMRGVLPSSTSGERYLRDRVVDYFETLSETNFVLASIAQKELDGTPISSYERVFLGDMLQVMQDYAFKYVKGWYPDLFYSSDNQFHDDFEFSGSGPIFDDDLVVADVHTQPTDETGTWVGKVLHAGTGPANMAVIVASPPGGAPTTFIGPVLSYYEHITLDFKRLIDAEWETMYAEAPSFRPAFSSLYLSDQDGMYVPGGPSLATGAERDPVDPTVPSVAVLAQNYPNPFSESTVIRFSIPGSSGPYPVSLEVYSPTGQLLATVIEESLTPGHYTARWDGSTASGRRAPSGTYSYVLSVGNKRAIGLMTKVR